MYLIVRDISLPNANDLRKTFLTHEYYKRHSMTLIIALACKDSVILAADGLSAATSSELDMIFGLAFPTSKINTFGDNILWGGAGSEGIIQTIEVELGKLPKKVKNMSLHDLNLQKRLKEIHRRCVEPEITRQNLYGVPPTESIGAQLLFVTNDAEYHNPIKIWSIGSLGYSVSQEQYGCGIIGSGTLYAHMSLLNFRSNSEWIEPRSKSLSTEQGCLVTYRAVRDAIEASLDRVGSPIDIWTIKNGEEPKQIVDNEKTKLEKAYLKWKEAEITKLQEII